MTFKMYRKRNFRSARTVLKLVASITHETRYEAAKVEHTLVSYYMGGNQLKVSETKVFGLVHKYYYGVRQQHPILLAPLG